MIYYILETRGVVMNKKINNFMLFIGLFFMDLLYSSLVVAFLQIAGINIMKMSLSMKYMSLILIDISFMLILYFIYRKDINNEFRSYFRSFKKYFTFGFKFWLLGLVLMIVSNLIIQHVYPVGASNEEAVQESLKMFPVYTVFASCIFAPFVEEVIFRKCLGKVFNNDILFIVVSGFLFGFAHTLASIGMGLNQMLYIIPYGLFGCVFAYMYRKTNNIFTSVMFHFIHNSILVTLSLLSVGVI